MNLVLQNRKDYVFIPKPNSWEEYMIFVTLMIKIRLSIQYLEEQKKQRLKRKRKRKRSDSTDSEDSDSSVDEETREIKRLKKMEKQLKRKFDDMLYG